MASLIIDRTSFLTREFPKAIADADAIMDSVFMCPLP